MACIHAYIHDTHMSTHTHAYIYAHTHAYIPPHTYTHSHIHVYMHAYTPVGKGHPVSCSWDVPDKERPFLLPDA